MKYLLRVLFVLALFVGFSSHAHGDNFHAQVLDPTCVTMPDAGCTLLPGDPGTPFSINLTASTCTDQFNAGNIPTLPAAPFGCFVGTNDTGQDITSIELFFDAGPLGAATCDTDLPNGAFTNAVCTPPTPGSPDPMYTLTFTGGTIIDSTAFIFMESGLPATDFVGTGVVNVVTPEPDSLLLLSSGAMMMTAGLFVKRRRLAFGKK
jgi:hypothetical protein